MHPGRGVRDNGKTHFQWVSALRPYLYVRPDMIEFVQQVFGADILA